MYQQYDKAVQTVLDFLIEQDFSRTPREGFRRATREFRRYLEEKCLEYSHSIAQAGLKLLHQVFRERRFSPSGGPLPWLMMQREMDRLPECDFLMMMHRSNTVCRSVTNSSLIHISSEGGRTATSHQHCRWIPVRAHGFFCSCNRRK